MAANEAQVNLQTANQIATVSDSNHIILVGEQSSEKAMESVESENQCLPKNSILRETRTTDNKSIMPRRSQSLKSVRSDDKSLKKFEAAKKLAQKKGEINAAIRSLKTNGDCWDVRQCFVRQFKTDYVRLIEGLVFEKKIFFLVTDKLKKLNFLT